MGSNPTRVALFSFYVKKKLLGLVSKRFFHTINSLSNPFCSEGAPEIQIKVIVVFIKLCICIRIYFLHSSTLRMDAKHCYKLTGAVIYQGHPAGDSGHSLHLLF